MIETRESSDLFHSTWTAKLYSDNLTPFKSHVWSRTEKSQSAPRTPVGPGGTDLTEGFILLVDFVSAPEILVRGRKDWISDWNSESGEISEAKTLDTANSRSRSMRSARREQKMARAGRRKTTDVCARNEITDVCERGKEFNGKHALAVVLLVRCRLHVAPA